MKNNIIFVTGTDTNIGKSYATGWFAKEMILKGINVITQKFIQTGNTGISEDIELHRKIMGTELYSEDTEHITNPIIFTYPASPHLASQIDNREINIDIIDKSSEILSNKYDLVLLEGAGGIMVPITKNYLTIDFIKEHNYPILFVTTGKLGSINHTILSLEAIENRGLNLKYVIYNSNFDSNDAVVSEDTHNYIKEYVAKHFPETSFLVMPTIKL